MLAISLLVVLASAALDSDIDLLNADLQTLEGGASSLERRAYDKINIDYGSSGPKVKAGDANGKPQKRKPPSLKGPGSFDRLASKTGWNDDDFKNIPGAQTGLPCGIIGATAGNRWPSLGAATQTAGVQNLFSDLLGPDGLNASPKTGCEFMVLGGTQEAFLEWSLAMASTPSKAGYAGIGGSSMQWAINIPHGALGKVSCDNAVPARYTAGSFGAESQDDFCKILPVGADGESVLFVSFLSTPRNDPYPGIAGGMDQTLPMMAASPNYPAMATAATQQGGKWDAFAAAAGAIMAEDDWWVSFTQLAYDANQGWKNAPRAALTRLSNFENEVGGQMQVLATWGKLFEGERVMKIKNLMEAVKTKDSRLTCPCGEDANGDSLCVDAAAMAVPENHQDCGTLQESCAQATSTNAGFGGAGWKCASIGYLFGMLYTMCHPRQGQPIVEEHCLAWFLQGGKADGDWMSAALDGHWNTMKTQLSGIGKVISPAGEVTAR